MTASNPRAVSGDNSAAMSPYEAVRAAITDLYSEAKNFCDGAKIDSAALAAEVERLEDDLKGAIKVADEARKAEAKPFDDAKDEIQERYNLLIGKTKTVKGVAILALEACQAALTPWRVEQLRIKNEAAAEALKVSNAAKEEALSQLFEARKAGDLAALEASEVALKSSVKAEKGATKLVKAVNVGTGLHTTYSAQIDDMQKFAQYAWVNRAGDLHEFLQTLADSIVKTMGQNAGGLQLPGVTIVTHTKSR